MEATQGQEKETVIIAPSATVVPEIVEDKKPENREVAYVIKDPLFGSFEVKKSSGAGRTAWWEDPTKLNKLVDAFKGGHIIKTALVYAGVSEQGWFRFNEEHPEFRSVKEACEEVQMLKFMNTINAAVDDPITARWFMDRRHPKFAAKVRVDGDLPLQPTVNVAVGIKIDEKSIQDEITRIAREVFGDSIGKTSPVNGQTSGAVEVPHQI